MLHKLFGGKKHESTRKFRNKQTAQSRRRSPSLERLEDRLAPACFSYFEPDWQPGIGLVLAFCDAEPDTATLRTDVGGNILFNNQPIPGGPTVANTVIIVMVGGDGNDRLDASSMAGFVGINIMVGGGCSSVMARSLFFRARSVSDGSAAPVAHAPGSEKPVSRRAATELHPLAGLAQTR